MRRLGQDAADKAIPLGGTRTVILFGALVGSRAQAGPGGEVRRRGERLGIHSHFGDELLRRVRAEAGDFGQPDYGILVLPQRRGVERLHLLDQQIDKLDQMVEILGPKEV